MVTEIDAAYFAGFFDGEGCILIAKDSGLRHGKRPSYTLTTIVGNIDKRPLTWLHDKFGGDLRPSLREGRQTVYYWRVSAKKAETFVRWIRPYLLVKAIQAWLGLEFLASRGLGGGRGRPLTDEDYALREGFYLALQNAKKDVY